MDGIVKSRPDMIKDLDRMRDLLEDLGSGLGVTDPVSGEAVAEITPEIASRHARPGSGRSPPASSAFRRPCPALYCFTPISLSRSLICVRLGSSASAFLKSAMAPLRSPSAALAMPRLL